MLLCNCSNDTNAVSTLQAALRSDSNSFAKLQSEYFQKLDLRVDATKLKLIPTFAAKLTSMAEGERKKLTSLQLSRQEKEHAGLVFIYDALMTMNNTDAAMKNILSLADLRADHRFGAEGGSDKEELLARAEYCIHQLTTALKLRLDDRRIDSWIESAKTQKDQIKSGLPPSNTLLKAAMDAIPIRPTFNLFTAILLFESVDAAHPLFERLAREAKQFVDATSSGDNPCYKYPQDCQNGSHAPYNLQASVTVLGDVFLRRSEYFLQKNDIPRAMEMAGYARETYSVLESPKHIEVSKTWPDRPLVQIRKDHIEQIHKMQMPSVPLHKTGAYAQAYDCASCHGRNR